MKLESEELLKLGYQPKPVVPPSAGQALSVLVAVCAVWWVWWMLPRWYWASTGDRAGQTVLQDALGATWVGFTLPLLNNVLVWKWATRPLWNRLSSNDAEDWKRITVLTLCGLFHLGTLICSLFVAMLLLACTNGDCTLHLQ